MANTHITVIYKWIAKPGKLEELKSIYEQVTEEMESNEPGAQSVQCYVSENDNVYIMFSVVRYYFGSMGSRRDYRNNRKM